LTEANNQMEEYIESYRVLLVFARADETSSYVARVPELPDCEVEAATRAEALSKVEEEISARLHNMKEQGLDPPVPLERVDFDGELSLKVTPELHRELAFMAKEADVELNVLLVEVLGRAVASAWTGRRVRRQPSRQDERGRRGRGMDDKRYHNIMDNRANFIEYVRQLEDGGGPAKGRGGGGRGRGGRGRGR